MLHNVPHAHRMARRLDQAVVRRPSLPLTAADEAQLAALRETASYRTALARLSRQEFPDDGDVRESVLLHAVFEAGLAAIRQLAEAEGYEQLASEYAADDATRRRLSRRRRPAWAADQ